MSKKGMFYSVSVIIFLVVAMLIFSSRSDVYKARDFSYTERAKFISTTHFVNDFEERNLQIILSSALKPALSTMIGVSPVDSDDLMDVMIDGNLGALPRMNPVFSTDSSYNQALYTLSFDPDNSFIYRVDSIRQVSYDTIQVRFLVDFEFSIFDTTWSDENVPIRVTFDVYGLKHPKHSLQDITSSWIEDPSGVGRFASDVFSSLPGVTVACGSSKNIMPP